ncbi:MAG: ribonuclease HII [Verrucomicrobia bacterium]|nr:ribonuclease HII [Verrucomicrobiota bacterium]
MSRSANAQCRYTTNDRFHFEREWCAQGVTLLAGMDEAGRGPLAGPVVAAAVCLPAKWCREGLPESLHGLNDSKQLSERRREEFFAVLTAHPEVRFGIAEVGPERIDEINILNATHEAMNLALARLSPTPQHVLVDGRPVKSLRLPHTAIVKGDSRSYSIAAASVLAKVTRDRRMLEFHALHPTYGFAAHKGYGTPQHLAALATHGPCPLHRRSFTWQRPVQKEFF